MKFEKYVPSEQHPDIDISVHGSSGPVEGTHVISSPVVRVSMRAIKSWLFWLFRRNMFRFQRCLCEGWDTLQSRRKYFVGYPWCHEGKSFTLLRHHKLVL